MKIIRKFEIEIREGPITVICPSGAKILKWVMSPSNHIGNPKKIWFWAIVDPENNLEQMFYFNIYGTDDKLREKPGRYVDSLFHWHIFEIDLDMAKEQGLQKTPA